MIISVFEWFFEGICVISLEDSLYLRWGGGCGDGRGLSLLILADLRGKGGGKARDFGTGEGGSRRIICGLGVGVL
jgi:hypothetical protein